MVKIARRMLTKVVHVGLVFEKGFASLLPKAHIPGCVRFLYGENGSILLVLKAALLRLPDDCITPFRDWRYWQ